MRVLILTTSFPLRPGEMSGIFIRNLIKNYPDYVKTIVLTPADDRKHYVFTDENFKVKCFRYAPCSWQILAHKPGGIPSAIRSNKKLVLLIPPLFFSMFIHSLYLAAKSDIIHANWSINGAIGAVVSLITKKPLVTALLGSDIKRAGYKNIDMNILRFCLKFSKYIITISEAMSDFLKNKFPACYHKLTVIPNGVGDEFFGLYKEADKTGPYGRTVTFIGNLTANKSVDTIIRAISEIKNPCVKLRIIGNGSELNHLKNLTDQYGLNDRVEFIGQIPHTQIPSYLKNSDILVLASYSEGMPNVVLEAMAAGVPVVASRIDGVKELIKNGENGFLFHPGDHLMLARKLEILTANEDLRKKFGKKGRDFMIDHGFRWPDVAMRYLKIYEKALCES